MNFDLIYQAPIAIRVHLVAAVLAFLFGAIILVSKKGTARHKLMGKTWVSIMFVVAMGSFWIHEINLWRGFSPIHLLSIVTLVSMTYAIWSIRQGNVTGHKRAMVSVYFFALLTAGLFTLMPGRLLARALFGWE